jgi:hypothetical protein
MCISQIYYYSVVLLTNRMNHTFKGIIRVVVITSMLVLGAGMFPIMQNASARSTNTNTNTNSATSDSDSTATASNTNDINNTASSNNILL